MIKGDKHRELLNYAKIYLLKKGFKEDEIFFNRLINKGDWEKSYVVDVVGQKGDEFIFIDCGMVLDDRESKLKELGKYKFLPFGYLSDKKLGIKSVALEKEQMDFIDDQNKSFNFSKFVRDKLDDYIKFKRRLNETWFNKYRKKD